MLNDVNVEALQGARDAIRETPSAGIASYGVHLQWHKGVQAHVKTLPMNIGGQELPRDFHWIIDEPPELLGESKGPTPQEFLMSGVGACIMVGFVVNASVKGIKIHSLDVEVTGGLDLAGFLNLRDDAEIKMSHMKYVIRAKADASEAALQDVAEKAFTFSPNAMTVNHGVKVTGELKIVE